tara:strand:+ start:48 stop:440 length:393 start_codon:yes stop_codon:yes gene_type:complete
MIDLKTTAEHLNELAQGEFSASRDVYGQAFEAAAQDHANLLKHAVRLEANAKQMAAEIRQYREQREHMADLVFDLMEERIKEKITEVIEDDHPTDIYIRQAVCEMVNNGDLSVEIDHQNIELELRMDANY